MEYVTRAEMARIAGVGRTTLWRLEKAGLTPPAERFSGNRSGYSPMAQSTILNLVRVA